MNPRIEAAKIITALGEYYDKQLSTTQLTMYVDDLVDIPSHKLQEACLKYRRNPANDRFPHPAKIRALVDPTAKNPEAEAIDAVSRIFYSISRFGSYRGKEARHAIGELGWKVVEREGGWENVCALVNDDNTGTIRAQWRQIALSIYTRADAGFTEPPKIPGSKTAQEIKQLVSGAVKEIEK